MNDVIVAARRLQEYCESQRWRHCIIGGLALLRWGQARLTVDVDLTLLTGFGDERKFVEALSSRFRSRVSDPVGFAFTNRVVLLQSDSGIGLDVALAGLPFEEAAVDRATSFTYPGDVALRTCSAEDLIVMKAFAARPKDWLDVEGVLVRQAGRLDWNYVETQLQPLVELKGEPEILERLQSLRKHAAE